MLRITKTIIFLILCIFQLNAQVDKLHSVEDLQEDFRILRTCLEKNHPGLYTYTSKEELDIVFENIEQSLHKPSTSIDFFRKVSSLLKPIGNGHSNMYVPTEYLKALNNGLPRFPFAIYLNNDSLYVLRNLSRNESILPGNIITHINGQASAELIQEITDKMTRDGINESFPQKRISYDFSGYYAFYKGTPKSHEIDWIDANGKTQQSKIAALPNTEIKNISSKRYNRKPKKRQAPLSLKIENDIAYLTVRSFDKPTIKKYKQNYKAFFKESFDKIKKADVKNLILDLRNNGGGWPEVIFDLYTYLNDKPYTFKGSAYTITNKIHHRKNYEYGFFEWIDFKKSLKLEKEGNIYRVKNTDNNTVLQPAPNAFKGELYILTNPFCFSATTNLLGMLRNSNRGIFIGEVAGGSPHQAAAWLMPELVLPNTKVKIKTPLVQMESELNFEDKKDGVHPDFYVKNSIQDVINKRDAVMEFTLNKIKNQ